MTEKRYPLFINEFWLKIIAIVLMTVDHIGVFFMQGHLATDFPDAWYPLRAIGRLAFPLFVFMLIEGVHKSRNLGKYTLRLGILFGTITVVETIYVYLISKNNAANTLDSEPFTDLFMYALFFLFIKQKGWKKALCVLPLIFIGVSFGVTVFEQAGTTTVLWYPRYLRCGYNLFGFLLALGFYFAPWAVKRITKPTRDSLGVSDETYVELPEYQNYVNRFCIFVLAIIVLSFWGISYIGRADGYAPYDFYYMGLESYCLLSIPFLFLYNGKRGYDSKAFRIGTYLYFPMHLAVLYLIFSLI